MNLQPEIIARELRSLLRGDVEFDRVSRRLYATDAGLSQIEPLGVVSPRDAEDVARLAAYAAEHGLSLVARGMGSGLNGGAVGQGIQIDFTRYMNQVLEVAPDASWVRVQPGVVMADLNRFLRPYGAFFAPDPSSENHCSLGGMMGTNASGAHSVAYGATKDHVLALDLVMSDGSSFRARPVPLESPEMAALLADGSVAGRAFSVVLPDLQNSRAAIEAGMPNVVKNSCGYRVESIIETAGVAHLQRLFVGAEGTLGLITEATLNLVLLPARRGVAMAYFPSIFAAGEAAPGIVALRPSAVEIMDSRFLALVRANDSRIDAMLPKDTDTALLIEFEGADDAELDEKFSVLERHLKSTNALHMKRAASAAETEHLWRVRKSAVALMQRMPGARQPLPFIEDICVHPTEMPACVDFLQKLFDREGVQAVMVGHMGDGNIHTRPVLDPKDPADRLSMQRIYDDVSSYVLGVRGTMAGEHGDGLIHTPRLTEMYGEEIYDLFARIKNAFDPQNILNPGKKVGTQERSHPLYRDVRYGDEYRTLPQTPILHFAPKGYEGEIERCHGCGVCKSGPATTMCPVYKATRREHASPRAKANLLRAVITGELQPSSESSWGDADTVYGDGALRAVTDYCIECGMCAVECPSRVNIPKLMLEAKSKYRAIHRASPVEMTLGRAETMSRLGSIAAPLANRATSNRLLRRLGEALAGIDRRRPMAPFASRTFDRQAGAGNRQLAAARGPVRRQPLVAYFSDLFANYNDPALALAVVRILEAHGLDMVIPEQRPSGIPEMLYGYAAKAAETARFNVAGALPYVRRGAALVTSEPTASLAFKVHYSDYVNDSETSLVANATFDLGEFLVRRRADHPESSPPAGPLSAERRRADGKPVRIAYHQPCHLKAQQIGDPAVELLREIPDVEVIDLAAGCCGMAGTFGMKTGSYDLSMRIGRPLFERVAEVAPDILTSDCSTCRMQLAHATGLTTLHPVMLLAEAYGV